MTRRLTTPKLSSAPLESAAEVVRLLRYVQDWEPACPHAPIVAAIPDVGLPLVHDSRTVGTMHQYAALLRGIAPSGTNMTNDKLRGVFERLGFAKVDSVLASGNIVFRSADVDVPTLEQRIEDALASDLGIASRTIIRAHSELRALLDSEPFPGLTHGRGTYLTATFLKDAATAPDVIPDQPDPRTRVVRYDRVARVVLAITDNSDPGRTPDFMSWLEKSFGKDITTRSWLTVQRIVKRLES